jgi:hypothetical protein
MKTDADSKLRRMIARQPTLDEKGEVLIKKHLDKMERAKAHGVAPAKVASDQGGIIIKDEEKLLGTALEDWSTLQASKHC